MTYDILYDSVYILCHVFCLSLCVTHSCQIEYTLCDDSKCFVFFTARKSEFKDKNHTNNIEVYTFCGMSAD